MKQIGEKSIKINMILNSVKGMLSIIFPLITFPYISRVLGVAGVGEYNFANSVISYFLLISGLGINSYAICYGAGCRMNQEKFSRFANQMFSINVMSTVVAYMLMILTIILVPKFQSYTPILIILSLQIIFKTIGIEWIYSIYEDYFYITIRSIVFQVISLLLLFLFVHDTGDVNKYAAVTVLAGVGSNILNFVYARKYCHVRFTFDIEYKKHLKSIMLFFSTAVTVTIYVSADTTILGFMCDDSTVGIYSVSVKVYTILKSVLSSAIAVSIPRMCSLWGNGDEKTFSMLGSDVYKTFLTIVVPAIVGVLLISEDIVLILAGTEYLQAKWSMMLLGVALFFCLGAGFWSQAVLIPQNKEAQVFKITVISAAINIILNIMLIPLIKEKAAAFTTIVAEAVVFAYCRNKGKKSVDLRGIYKLLRVIIIGCLPMFGIKYVVSLFFQNLMQKTLLIVFFSILLYFIIEISLKNSIIIEGASKIYLKLKSLIL